MVLLTVERFKEVLKIARGRSQCDFHYPSLIVDVGKSCSNSIHLEYRLDLSLNNHCFSWTLLDYDRRVLLEVDASLSEKGEWCDLSLTEVVYDDDGVSSCQEPIAKSCSRYRALLSDCDRLLSSCASEGDKRAVTFLDLFTGERGWGR